MTTAPDDASPVPEPPRRVRRFRLVTGIVVGLLIYLAVAYLVMPLLWETYAHRHPALDSAPNITVTKDGHPGDPINVGLIGTQADLESLLSQAGWYRAAALGLKSDLKIAVDTVVERPYDEAPVSNLYLYGRKEDLAYEQPVGDNPRQRHHVRFWSSSEQDEQGRPLWFGSATYDERVGLSHTTGQITHHIAADVDVERDHLFKTLIATGRLTDVQYIDNFHPNHKGHNGGGDLWQTDGRLRLGTIVPAAP
ncbi:hypothetical protein GC163_20860 [bacterium]|nr:hypothetical protein [bacterium]